MFTEAFIQAQIKDNNKALRHWPLRGRGDSHVTGEIPAQMGSGAETVSIWWRHHVPLRYYKYGFTESLLFASKNVPDVHFYWYQVWHRNILFYQTICSSTCLLLKTWWDRLILFDVARPTGAIILIAIRCSMQSRHYLNKCYLNMTELQRKNISDHFNECYIMQCF